jgi:hypothetical protein
MIFPESDHRAGTEAHKKHLSEVEFHEFLVHAVRQLNTDEHSCIDIDHLERSFMCVFEAIQEGNALSSHSTIWK